MPNTMNLTNDLLIKALEVGVATFVGNSVASQQEKKPQKKSSFFNLGKKEGTKSRNSDGVDAAQVNTIISEVFKVAEQLPAIVEKGGPDGKRWVKLVICIGIDLVGSGSLAVPFLGDALDLVTAPVMATMLQALFGSTLVTVGGLAEEILPGTDGIPTATLAWLAEYFGLLNSEEGKSKKI